MFLKSLFLKSLFLKSNLLATNPLSFFAWRIKSKIKNSIKQQLVGNQTFELINKILKSKSVHLIKILRQRNFLHKQDKIRQDLLLTHCLLSHRMERNFLKIQTTNVCNPWSVKIAIFTTLKNTIFLKANFSIIELFAK